MAVAVAVGEAGGLQERCPQCGVGFGDAGSLVARVGSFHPEVSAAT